MVRRIKQEDFDHWWKAKKAQWDQTGGDLWEVFSQFRTSERSARVYRRVERQMERERPDDYVWHATYLHRAYGRRRGHR